MAIGRRALRPARVGEAFALIALAAAGAAQAEQGMPRAGAYQVEVRLELPNVLRRGVDRIVTVCLPYESANGAPFPVLSANNPLASCPAGDIERDGTVLRFAVACEGRGAAQAYATYQLMPERFEGRIAMVMGGKNMTMTEVQSGRRIGNCEPPDAPAS